MAAPNISVEIPTRPRLVTTDWTKPVDHGEEPQEVSPLSRTNSFRRQSGQDVEGSVLGGSASPSQVGSTVSTSAAPAQLDARVGGVSSEIIEHLRKIIKEEVAEHLKSGDTTSPLDTSRTFEANLASSMFSSSSYPSPPPSVVCASTSSKLSSPEGGSPKVANATPLTPTSVASPTKPAIESPQQTPTVRFRSRGRPIIHVHRSDTSQTPSSTLEWTAVDEKWGRLFDQDGYSTQRLGQVLRGLANHMILEFNPPNSIVVTPEKLLVLYTFFKLDSERFPFQDIFRPRSKDSLERIEYLYQDLGCEYHLVQADTKSRPNIPGLTPTGFVKWITHNILAYPEQEARRLGRIVSELPITADGPLVDGKPERLPRQLSRYLLPSSHDKKTRSILDEAILDCTEDAIPPLPDIASSRSRLGSSSEKRAPLQSNTYSKRSVDDRRQSIPLPPRDSYTKTYVDRNGYRVEAQPSRSSRANSDGSNAPQGPRLPPPPMGRNSVPARPRSPPPRSRFSTSVPNINQGSGFASSPISSSGQFTPSSSYSSGTFSPVEFSPRDVAGPYSPRDSRSSVEDTPRSGMQVGNPRDKEPSAADRNANRRSLVIADRNGPTWDDYYRAITPTGVRPPSFDGGSSYQPSN